MYLEIITGFDPNKPMTEEQKQEYFKKRDALVRDFMPIASSSTTKKVLSTDFVYDKEDGKGFYYGLKDPKTGSIYFNYYFSDFEFGSGLRKNDSDKRMKIKDWKRFIMSKLAAISPELAKRYLEEWNKTFEEFILQRHGQCHFAMEEIKHGCLIGADIVEDNTSGV